jgi:hypothetical protein
LLTVIAQLPWQAQGQMESQMQKVQALKFSSIAASILPTAAFPELPGGVMVKQEA